MALAVHRWGTYRVVQLKPWILSLVAELISPLALPSLCHWDPLSGFAQKRAGGPLSCSHDLRANSLAWCTEVCWCAGVEGHIFHAHPTPPKGRARHQGRLYCFPGEVQTCSFQYNSRWEVGPALLSPWTSAWSQVAAQTRNVRMPFGGSLVCGDWHRPLPPHDHGFRHGPQKQNWPGLCWPQVAAHIRLFLSTLTSPASSLPIVQHGPHKSLSCSSDCQEGEDHSASSYGSCESWLPLVYQANKMAFHSLPPVLTVFLSPLPQCSVNF